MHIFCDFEYRRDGAELILFCAWNTTTGERIAIDMRQPGANARLADFVNANRDAVWFAYAAEAEIGSLLTAGIDPAGMAWVDLMTEAKQVTGTHAAYRRHRADLLTTLQAFDIPTPATTPHKLAMRELILSGSDYTAEQWRSIVEYCWSDIDPLPHLWDAIQEAHAGRDKPYPLGLAAYRGDYLVACATLNHRSRGFPLDMDAFTKVFSNLKLVRKFIAERCNERYGAALYRWNKARGDYSFSFAALETLIDNLPIPVEWATTPSGRLKLDADYLGEFCRRNEYFKHLHDTKMLLDQLKDCRWPALVKDGFLKGRSIPFYTVTGRNQPLVSAGYILNSPPWLRHLVRPQPQHVLLGADWSQQEIVLAAALSGDPKLIEALQSGDVYLAIAKLAGAVPDDATKHSHPIERQSYKSVQLGIGYGMGARTLGRRIFLDLRDAGADITPEEAADRATDIYRWHKRTFAVYWDYVNQQVALARQQGYLTTLDGWTYFADYQTSFTKVQNFPMQANAAVILRESIKRLATHKEIEFVCSLHDAIYIYAHEDDAIAHENTLRRCMQEATAEVMQFAAVPMQINVEVKCFDHATGYRDERGTDTFAEIMAIIAANENQQMAA